jgi:hypothetical protein
VLLAAVTRDGHAVLWLTPEERTPDVLLAAVTRDVGATMYLTPEERATLNNLAD